MNPPLLITVRGTSGSGKSTVLRIVMEGFGSGWRAEYILGRKRPLYYRLLDPVEAGGKTVAVLGHYEIACGGCDTIGSVPEVFRVLNSLLSFDVVLAEGLLLSEDVIWTLKHGVGNARCIFLATSLEECLRRVELRQAEKGKPPVDPQRVVRKLTRRIETINRARLRLEKAGVECLTCSSKSAPEIIAGWLEVIGNNVHAGYTRYPRHAR